MEGGEKAVKLRIAEQYVKAFGEMAKTNNTMIVPTQPSNVAGMVATALGIYKNIDLATPTQSGRSV
jgi:hypothetical protein